MARLSTTTAGEIVSSSGSGSLCCGGTGSGTTTFWKVLQFCNTIIVCGLIGVVVFLFLQLQYMTFRLNQQQQDIDDLRIQVQEKQEGQIQQLNAAVQQEHDLTIQTLAGTFTLLTCLISMFHMSSHVRNYTEPNVQRKIVAILWMSPIYSCTSFLSLLFPSAQEYLSIIKDFYESYCIYTFLSFLIAVLGRSGNGDREAVVDVLSKHAHHLDKPTRCLRPLYHPSPETSDRAYANAVLTECQILCLQFVFIRPITSVLNFVFTFGQEELETYQANHHHGHSNNSSSIILANGTRFLAEVLGGDTAASTPAAVFPNNSTWAGNGDSGGGGGGGSDSFAESSGSSGTSGGGLGVDDNLYYNATMNGGIGGEDDSEFSQAAISYFTSPGFYFAMITNVSVFFAFTGLLKFYHAVRDDLTWCQPFPKFLTIKGVVFLTFWQGLAISIVVNLKQRNNTTSHWAQNELDDDPRQRAQQLQNVLICLEMLFFSITHWCVFPAEEWEPNYQPKTVANPGIGFQDFVSDVSQIYNQAGNNRRSAARRRRQRKLEKQQRPSRSRGARDGYGIYQVASTDAGGGGATELGIAPTSALDDEEGYDEAAFVSGGGVGDGAISSGEDFSSSHDDISTSGHDEEDFSNNTDEGDFQYRDNTNNDLHLHHHQEEDPTVRIPDLETSKMQ